MKRALVLAAIVATAAPSAAQTPTQPQLPRVTMPIATQTLANGMTLVVQEDHRTPRVAVSLWYDVGSKDEVAGKYGFAHLFEHLMLEAGSRHVAPGDFFRKLEAAGATNIQCTTTVDRTNYREVVPSAALETALWLESDRMAFLLDRIDARALDAQKATVENERKLNYDDAPLRVIERAIRAEVFPLAHPNHRSPMGEPADVAGATLHDVRAFFHAWYAPNNATLVLAGDVDMARAKVLVEKWFGTIPTRPLPARAPVPQLKSAGEVRLFIEAQLAERYVLVSWPTPPTYAEGDAELAVVQRILSGGRLHRRLMRDESLVREVRIAHDQPVFGQHGELFEISAVALGAREHKDVLAAIDDEIARVRAGDVTDAEIASAKAAVLAEIVFAVERLHDRAERIHEYARLASDPAFFERHRQRVESISRAAIVDAARRFLSNERRVVTFVMPNPKLPEVARVVRVARRP
jgi:predicted Zn-dependent peptidase